MFIILISHTPGNYLIMWIPARFGFSDAAEIFVFCSGMASAIAFGKTFDRKGWFIGTARVAYRCWQVYWAHICLFFFIAMMVAAFDASGWFEKEYVGSLNLKHFFADPRGNLVGLFTLTYVPNFFDILPMYLVILAMLPFVMALSHVSLPLTGVVLVSIWMVANQGYLQFPAEPWSLRVWFFNPMAWQLLFFTGFAFMRGWLPAPPVNRWLIGLAGAVVLISLPIAYYRIRREFPGLEELYSAIEPFRSKTNEGILRYVHFLSLAYLGWVAAGVGGRNLIASGAGLLSRIWGWLVAVIIKVGQQSLAIFVFSMAASRVLGMMLDVVGRNNLTMTIVNLIGFAALILVAYLVAWFKAVPWRKA